ncbi:hypothetical protein [Streptomyces sp. CAI-85]|nr:hypothetical protein [Streptomyces sp. CAI-85]
MTGAVTMHLRRGEIPAPAPSGTLLILAVPVAWGTGCAASPVSI